MSEMNMLPVEKRVECVVVCVDYADFLAVTLPCNRYHFDKLVVVTTPEDKATQQVCMYNDVQVVTTDCFNINGGEFRKACGINVGLQYLSKDAWWIHLDADIVLPPQTRKLLRKMELDPTMVYGIDRHRMMGDKIWAEHVVRPKFQHGHNVYVHTEHYPVQTRFMFPAMGGYMPVGFFQMWNPQGSGVTHYPENHTNAGRTDMLFANQWMRSKRGFIPEMVGYHLESESVSQGANWGGRTTKSYGPRARWDQRFWASVKRFFKHIWQWIEHFFDPPGPYETNADRDPKCPHCGGSVDH